jgi:hypothetical protein
MNLNRLEERLAPLDGIAAVILWVAGVVVLQWPAHQPPADVSGERALAFFQDHTGTILLGTFLFLLGSLFFLWFLGLIRMRLVAAEGGSHRVSSIAFAAGVGTAISLIIYPAVHAAGAVNNPHLSPDAAQVYLGINFAFFYAAEFSAAVFLFAIWLLSLSTRVFPAWLAWSSLVLMVWLLIAPIGWAGMLYGFPLWLIAVSVVLWTRSRSDSRPDPAHRTP